MTTSYSSIIIRDALNTASSCSKESSWKFLHKLGKRYKHFEHEEIIFSMICEAVNQLQSNVPATFDDLENGVLKCVALYRQDRARNFDQRYYEDIRLKCELEPEVEKLLQKSAGKSGACVINFAQISGYLADIKSRTNLEPLYEALAEVETSNTLIRACTQAIEKIDTKIDSFYAWSETSQYQHFKESYGKLRHQQIKNLRKTQSQRVINVR